MKPKGISTIDSAREFFTLMIYADPGAGKTWIAGSSARADNDTLIIRAPTDSAETVRIHHSGFKVEQFVARDWDDMDEIHEYVRHEDHGYRWIWADSVPLLQEIGLDSVMADLIARKPTRNEFVPDKGEYGENMSRISKWIRHMASLDFNFGMTAHEMRYVSPKTGEEAIWPWVQGKMMTEKICAYATVVGHLEVVESEKHGDVRVLHTRPHGEYYAKDGLGAFPEGRILRPTVPKLEDAIARIKNKNKDKKEAAKRTTRKKATKKTTAAKAAANPETPDEGDDEFTF